MAYNPPIGSIYHLYTTYILPSGGLYATYHLLWEPETTIDKMLESYQYDLTNSGIHSQNETPLKAYGPFSGRFHGPLMNRQLSR